MARPLDLPEFDAPPLNEVVLGIQFDPPTGYQQLLAGEVWGLFRKEFPRTEERPALPPTFETFGAPGGGVISLQIANGASHDRFWFLSPDGTELIQFQNDRLLHNWRKNGAPSAIYPRYERISSSFSREAEALQTYMAGLGSPALVVRQCEVTYINVIPITSPRDFRVGDWLKPLQFEVQPDDLNFASRRIIRTPTNQPVGRLIVEVASALGENGAPVLRFGLTVRGMPPTSTIASAIEFLTTGRDMIVREFCAMTTDAAHQAWRRTK